MGTWCTEGVKRTQAEHRRQESDEEDRAYRKRRKKIKPKDYLDMFVKYAAKHGIEYRVSSTGYIGSICLKSFNKAPVDLTSYGKYYKLGSKAAYDWLVESYEESMG